MTAAYLFRSAKSRLLFGWGFASLVSVGGLEGARVTSLDPGPAIVCVFAAGLVLVGVGRYLKARQWSPVALARVGGFAVLLALFFAGTTLFRKPVAHDEMKEALAIAATGDAAKLRRAMTSFAAFPDRAQEWAPAVIAALKHEDEAVREAATLLLTKHPLAQALPALHERLREENEESDSVREEAVAAVLAAKSAQSARPLLDAAKDEPDADIATQMCVAALTLSQATPERVEAAEALLKLSQDTGSPAAARREAQAQLAKFVALPAGAEGSALASWWSENKAKLRWDAQRKQLILPAE